MSHEPLVTVIMPAYNTELYIGSAIESILDQTFTDFEFLIFDDCSTDRTAEIIESYQDKRIRLIRHDKNAGYTRSLIEGIQLAGGKYIARMDSDDISLPERFEKMVTFLENNKDYGLIGSFVQVIRNNQPAEIWEFPEEDINIRLFSMIDSPFAHPSVMMRREVLVGNQLTYQRDFEPSEDFKLWTDMLEFSKGKNLPEVLLQYRLHEKQTIALRKETLIRHSNKVRQQVLNDFFDFKLTDEDSFAHFYFFNENKTNDASSIISKYKWRNRLSDHFKKKKNKSALDLVESYWLKNLHTLGEFRFSFLRFLLNKKIILKMSFGEVTRFITKCLFSYKIKPNNVS